MRGFQRTSECASVDKRALLFDSGSSRSAVSAPERLESKQRLHDLSP